MYNITTDIVLDAYKKGLFPMAENHFSKEIYWVDPDLRGILQFKDINVPRSLKKIVNKNIFKIAIDKNFIEVINSCAKISKYRPETWINKSIKNIYIDLYHKGHAHSVECYLNNDLVGGLYGLSIGSVFFGESMFSFVSNASKVAFTHLLERLIIGNYMFLDTQFVNNHLRQFGVSEIKRDAFRIHLLKGLQSEGDFFSMTKSGYIEKKTIH